MSEKVKRYNGIEQDDEGVYVYYDDYEAAECKIAEQEVRIKELDQSLGNLLAIIHGDGGHYYAKHGAKKAVNDAHAKYCGMLVRIDELASLLQVARDQYNELIMAVSMKFPGESRHKTAL